MDAHELARWTRFAAKGGIGRCTATVDCIAQEMGEDLMFLKDDEITVLMQLPEPGVYLGHCEGVVGRFSGKDVQFHSKLKKPVMAKRGSVTVGTGRPESRVSFSLVEGSGSSTELPGERSRHASESPSNSRPGSRAKQTPSPSYSKSHVHTQSYSTSYSRFSEDQSATASPDSRDTTVVGTSRTPTIRGVRTSSTKSGHAKPPQMITSISGVSVFSVESASVYSEASTATSVCSSADGTSERTRSRNGSIYSINSAETEKDVSGEPEQVNVEQANGASNSTSVLASTSTSGASFTSTSTVGPDSVIGSFGSVGSIAELEVKQFDSSKFGVHAETQTGFVLAPPPLGIGGNRNGTTSPAIAPLRVSKPPRLTPSPGLPPALPLPMPPATSGENLRSTSVSPVSPSPLSPGKPGPLSPRPLISSPLGLPGSLSPGQRSPGLPGSLSPGFRSPAFAHGPNAQFQYTFSSGSGPNSPNPYLSLKNPYGSTPPPALTSLHVRPNLNPNEDNGLTLPAVRTPPVSSSSCSAGQTHGAPLSPPPSSPLPPLPAASLPSPAFPVTALPTLGALPATVIAVSGRTSPLASLPSLPLSTSGALYVDDRDGRGDGDRIGDGAWDEVGEGNTTGLSTLDAFRRRFDDSADLADGDEIGYGGHSEDEGERVLGVSERQDEGGARVSGNEKGEREGREDTHSDGEVGIGLSLMGALGSEADEDEAHEDEGRGARNTKGGNDSESGASDVGGVSGKVSDNPGKSGGTTAMTWTRYTPTSPISAQDPNEHRQTGEKEDKCGSESEEDEDDGAYWDDIYDGYRYSRYSLASKRLSAGSKRVSTMSKASGASKVSSKARANAPPMPVPPDRLSFDAPGQGVDSDGTSGYPRPSLESTLSSMSAPMPFSRSSLTRSASDESTHATHGLPLTAQFPAVPVHVPVRTESQLRIVHDGYMQGSDDHGERELEVEHGSTEEDTGEVGLSIEVVEVAGEDASQGQEVDVGRQLTSLNANTALSPLLHTTFGSPHSSRFTDFEDGSDQDHWRRHSNKSGKSTMSSAEGPPRSPMDGGGTASALRARLEVERAPSSGTAPFLAPVPNSSSRGESGVRAIVLGDGGDITGINITVNDATLATEVASPLPTSTQTSTVAHLTVATNPAQAALAVDQPEDTEKSSFLRPRPQPGQSPHPFARTSLFLPHPNAPKAVHQSQGPMYGRTTPQSNAYPVTAGLGAGSMAPPPTLPGTTFFSTHVLHQLRSVSIAASQGPARRPPMTLFARCESDLNMSMGPVPILFSLDPFPPLAMPFAKPQMKVGGGNGIPYLANMTPTRAATVSVPARRGGGDAVPPKESGPGVGGSATLRLPRRSTTVAASVVGGPQGIDVNPSLPSLPIPREGFVPQVGAIRPRSRSFSSLSAHVPTPTPLQVSSREEPVMKVQGVASVTASPRKMTLPSVLMPRHALPPLILQSNSEEREPDGKLTSAVIQSSDPFTREPLTHSPQFFDATQVANTNGSLGSPVVGPPFANGSDREKDVSPVLRPSRMTSRTSMSSSEPRSATPPLSLMPGRQVSLDVPPRNGSVERPPRQSSDSSDSCSLASPPPIPEAASQGARFSPLVQEPTLRTKLSLPALRVKASIRAKVDDAVSVVSFPGSGENETVQVQDMDFELVKPSIPQVTGRASQESTLTGRDVDIAKPDASPILGDASSMHSSAPRSPLVPPAPTESAESIDAHRQRELKWMALFPVVPPSQARKNKKVRRLLQEGVPSSVRYLVWCHLTDSKARALPGVYAKLGRRPPVSVFAEIERDAAEGFPDQPQLHTAQGPIVSLLQAYLSMVPDIQYSSGLTSIAGHLLLLAPEEDAFWIFASMMDAHLRTYFSTNTVQIEIDASLFSKALETVDPVLTKKLYMRLSIAPASITRPWFSTLFVGSLSIDHLHRVWDIFLCDGIPFLFRVGLVVVNCIRHLLLQVNTEEAALALLVRPPPACLPSATELLVLAANVKLKDDDVRKQRVKMEQQLKRTTQARPPNGMSNVQTVAISLPKT